MPEYLIILEESPSVGDIDELVHNLVQYNDTRAEKENWQKLVIFLRKPEGKILGGLNGYTHWNWLAIDQIWITEELRNQGWGRKLMECAEKEALKRGCQHAHVDTFDFQALPFYEKLGYRIFGKLDDFPSGHSRFFLQKWDIGSNYAGGS